MPPLTTGKRDVRAEIAEIKHVLHERPVFYEIICKRYNHSSPAVTMRYLGIEDKEVHNTLMNEIG